MIWNRKCRKVRHSLALWVGNDLDDAGRLAAQRHLATCPSCREEWQRLQSGHATIESLRTSRREPPPEVSVWPSVAMQIRAISEEPVEVEWRDWLPSGALAAACLTLILTLPQWGSLNGASSAGSDVIDSQPVAATVPQFGDSVLRDHRARQAMSLESRGAIRVRTLLDGTDVRAQ